MKKKNIINLIRFFAEKNENGFRNEAYEIARDFDESGDAQLAEYIMALLSSANTFVPQITENDMSYFEKVSTETESLPLPTVIEQDIIGVINAINRNLGVNKFLLQGPPGTGKTESAKHIARILNRELYSVSISTVIDSKLGQTAKNITGLFREMNECNYPSKVIFMFDEVDALAMDRTNSTDLREMGRATTAFLRELDKLNEQIVIIATTNLFDHFDKALIRRFDAVIDYDRYTRDDLLDISESILNSFLQKYKSASHNIRLFRKIINIMDPILMPGELKNMIKTSIAFSDPGDNCDYLKRIFAAVIGSKPMDIKSLQEYGFTIREIESLTGISKSQVARFLKEGQG